MSETQKQRWIRKSAEIAYQRYLICKKAVERYEAEDKPRMAATERSAMFEAMHILRLIEAQSND